MAELENPRENPCFGCGPQHPRGLRLRFERSTGPDGVDEIVTHFTPQTDEVGWPTLYHHGLHFTVLYEASYWAALTLGARLWVSQGVVRYDALRLPRVGVPHTARARIVGREANELTVRCVSASEAGKPCGTLESSWVPVRREVVDRAGIPLPDYLIEDIPP